MDCPQQVHAHTQHGFRSRPQLHAIPALDIQLQHGGLVFRSRRSTKKYSYGVIHEIPFSLHGQNSAFRNGLRICAPFRGKAAGPNHIT